MLQHAEKKGSKNQKKKAQHVLVHVHFCTGNIAPYKPLHYDTLFEAELVLIIIINMNLHIYALL